MRIDQRGITTRYDYSQCGLLTRRQDAWTSPTDVESYFYSPVRELTLAQKGSSGDLDDSASTSLYYHWLGVVTRSDQAVEETTAKIVSAYFDANGDRTKLVYPSANVDFSYAFDLLGRVTQVKDNGGTARVEYSYFGGGLSKRRYPTPDLDAIWSYDKLLRVTKIVQQKATGPSDRASYAYAYDNMSNATGQVFVSRTNAPTSEYEFDTLNRLTYAFYFDNAANGTHEYQYDDLGNRTHHKDRSASTVTYYYNDVNEYSKINWA